MSRGFGATLGVGTTDVITTGFVNSGSNKRSYSVFINRNGNGGNGRGCVFSKIAGASQSENFYFLSANTQMAYARVNGAGTQTAHHGMNTASFPGTGSWFHFLLTHDQSSGALTAPVGWYDGVINSSTQSVTARATVASDNTSAYLIGNTPAATENFDGLLAHLAVWDDIILDGAAARMLAGGAHPSVISPGNLVCYMPLDGINNPEIDFCIANGPTTSITGTAFGATQPSNVPLYIAAKNIRREPAFMQATAAPPTNVMGPMVSIIT